MFDWLVKTVFHYLLDVPEPDSESESTSDVTSSHDPVENGQRSRSPPPPAADFQVPVPPKFEIVDSTTTRRLDTISHMISILPVALAIPDASENQSPSERAFRQDFGEQVEDEDSEDLNVFNEGSKPILQLNQNSALLCPLPASTAASSACPTPDASPSEFFARPSSRKRTRSRMNHAMEEIIELSEYTVLKKRLRDHPPDNEELEKSVLKVLETVDLTKTNMAMVYQKVCVIHSPHDLARRKPFMKSIVRHFMLEKFKEASEAEKSSSTSETTPEDATET